MKTGDPRVKVRGSTLIARFEAPEQVGSSLDPAAAARVLMAAADITLSLGPDGVVRDLAIGNARLRGELPEAAGWRGRRWQDLVTLESRAKIDAMLAEAAERGDTGLRHLNHPADGADVAIQYKVVVLSGSEWIAFGTDLQPWSRVQQRLIQAQQTMERDYGALRRAQGRFRLVFETSIEPLFLIDTSNGKVMEVNEAARLISSSGRRHETGWSFGSLFERRSRGVLARFFSVVEATGLADPVSVRLAEDRRPVIVAADLLQEDDRYLLLVRIRMQGTDSDTTADDPAIMLNTALAHSPDGLVVCDGNGVVQSANAGFISLIQLPARGTLRGRSIEDWLGRDGGVLLANLQQHGALRLFATRLHGEGGSDTEIEISAWTLEGGIRPLYGLAVRDVERRLPEERHGASGLPDSVEQLSALVGRVSLKDLVRKATEAMERVCIETALDLTGDNRASAAEMLGLSRQSLYLKLNRLGLVEREAPMAR